jgi:hypothetical protein
MIDEKGPTPLKLYLTTIIENPLFKQEHDFGKRKDMPAENETIERWKRLAYLLWCNNGDFHVSAYGVTTHGDFPWKVGLDMTEAMELMHYASTMQTASWYEGTFNDVFMPLINQYIASVLEHQKRNSTNKPKDESQNP